MASSEAETEAQLRAGEIVRLAITDLAFGGEGVGRLGDFVLFVPFVIPGEVVEIEVVEVKRRYARGSLRKVVIPSPLRVDPPCPYFGECGGCQYQHLVYAEQLKAKHKQIVDLFQRIGNFDSIQIPPVVPSPQIYHYRNRIMVRTQWDKVNQRLNLGFIRTDNRLVVDVENCRIAEEPLNQELIKLRQKPPPKGGLKTVLRVLPEGWELPRDSFFQNNFFLLPELVRAVRAIFTESGNRFLLDLYCGVGFFALELSDLVESFAGVEVDSAAIKAARANMASRGARNGVFLGGRVEELLPEVLRKFAPHDTTILLDPPRTGCPSETIALLMEAGPSQIVYVSCHPATLARDLNGFCANGVYNLKRIIPLDMFPQTQHVECVAALERRKA